MPELPEVETMRRGIAHLVGIRIEAAAFPRHTRRPISVAPTARVIAGQLAGRTIVAVHRYGKRVGIELAGDRRTVAKSLVVAQFLAGEDGHAAETLALAPCRPLGAVQPRLEGGLALGQPSQNCGGRAANS